MAAPIRAAQQGPRKRLGGVHKLIGPGMGNDVRAVSTVTRHPYLQGTRMHNFAAAQRRYDRRLPAEAPPVPFPNPMEMLREDLAHRLAAQDIASAVWDILNDTDDDIDMIRKAAHGDHAGAMALFCMAIQTVAKQRLL